MKKPKRKIKEEHTTKDSEKKTLAVLPYVKGVTEPIERAMRKAGVATACKPLMKMRQLIVHPKDRRNEFETTDCIYKIPCGSCNKSYIGETGRKFAVRLHEHQRDVRTVTEKAYTRAQKKIASTIL